VRVDAELWARANEAAREQGYRELSLYVGDALRLLADTRQVPWAVEAPRQRPGQRPSRAVEFAVKSP
jgi:hypothetical protein